MKPVNQSIYGNQKIGYLGDCQRAVIASLLELEIDEVPHFSQEANGNSDLAWAALQSFCQKMGYAYLNVPATTDLVFFGLEKDVNIYHEISGPSPRGGGLHAVVGLNGKIFFDTHPSNAGLSGEPKDWTFSYLVAVNPQKHKDIARDFSQALP
jgi:hypothetical protein